MAQVQRGQTYPSGCLAEPGS